MRAASFLLSFSGPPPGRTHSGLGDSASSTSPHLLRLLRELAAQSLAPGKFLIPVDCGSWVYSQLCRLGLPSPHCHVRPGLTRDPGLNILLPDLFSCPLHPSL